MLETVGVTLDAKILDRQRRLKRRECRWRGRPKDRNWRNGVIALAVADCPLHHSKLSFGANPVARGRAAAGSV
jgi:hypothetical protein